MLAFILRVATLSGLMLAISDVYAADPQPDSNLLPLSIIDGVPYLEGIKLGMHADQVTQILTAAGYTSTVQAGVIKDYKKNKQTILVSRNPNVPIKSIKYQFPGNFDLHDAELNFKQKKRYVDLFKRHFPDKSSCRLKKNINAPAFCKYKVMHLGKLKYRVELQIVNTTIQVKYNDS